MKNYEGIVKKERCGLIAHGGNKTGFKGKHKKPTATYIIGMPLTLCNENQHQDGILDGSSVFQVRTMVFWGTEKGLFFRAFTLWNYPLIRTNEISIPTIGSTKSPANIGLAGFMIFEDGTLDGSKENFSVA